MKKIILTGLLFLFVQRGFAQFTFDGTSDNLMVLSGGVQELFTANTAFNGWSAANYNKHFSAPFTGNVNLAFINFKNYEIGGNLSWNSLYGFGGGYLGRSLTSSRSGITSWLDIDIGYFYANYGNQVLPLNYTLTPDQVGKQLELHYTSTYIGITSKNYFNKQAIRVGVKRLGATFIPALHFSVGYEPFNNTGYQYGYYYTRASDTSKQFRGVPIRNIPHLSKLFFSAGLSISVAGKQ
jgi:hypothetical protein